MAIKPFAKLTKLLEVFPVVRHKTRRSFLVDFVSGLIRGRSVVFSEVADKIDKPIQLDSIERRLQDFMLKVDFDYEQLALLLICFVPHQKMVLSMDRTEWDRGTHQYNILCIVASIGKMAIPIYWEMLDNKSGNSSTGNRISILEKVIETLGHHRIKVLTMDREFIGHRWLKWLKKRNVPFCVRVPKSHLVHCLEGYKYRAEELLSAKGHEVLIRSAIVDGVVVDLSISKGKDGKLLFLIGTVPAQELRATYRQRWPIEVFFQATKGRGFNMEATGLRNSEKLRKLFGVVSLAYAICWLIGIEQSKLKPVKVKKHGYPQYSVFRRGLNAVRQALKTQQWITIQTALQLILRRSQQGGLKTVG